MRHILFLILCLTGFFGSAQDSVTVVVEVNDEKWGDPVRNVNATITLNGKHFFDITNNKGRFTFTSVPGTGVSVNLSHVRYNSEKYFRKIPSHISEDTILYMFTMGSIRMQEVDEIVVAAPGVPVEVFASKRLHVEDFEMMNDGNLLLLTYSKRLKKGSELVVYDGKNIRNSFQVPGIAQELVCDYRGNPHVICKENVYGVHTGDGQIGISSLEKEYYMKYLAPIVDTNKTKVYFSTFNPDYPAFEYFSFDQMDSAYKKIMGIRDELMMELYRSEYKWVDVRTKLWAKHLELETGIDAEIWVGANYFTQSIYYKELYAPLFHRNDSLFVFDYYKDLLFTFDAEGNKLDSVGIYHHYQPRRTGWKGELIQDRRTGQIYAIYDRAGFTYLGWVDTKTGEITEQVKLEYRYVNKVAVFGNFVYYVYRPFESVQKKYLYQERLPYHFGKADVPKGDAVQRP